MEVWRETEADTERDRESRTERTREGETQSERRRMGRTAEEGVEVPARALVAMWFDRLTVM